MGTLTCFSAIFTKGNNFSDFLFVPLYNKVLPKLGLLVTERICSMETILSCRTPFEGVKTEKCRVASPVCVPIYLKLQWQGICEHPILYSATISTDWFRPFLLFCAIWTIYDQNEQIQVLTFWDPVSVVLYFSLCQYLKK